MRLIGYWIESLLDKDYVPPQELLGPFSEQLRHQLTDYLDRGEVYETYRGTSWCRFRCQHPMGNREFSDGLWVWPEDLGHYVRDHGIVLPDEFVRRVLADAAPLPRSQWQCSSPNLDRDFWKAWCQTHASGSLRSQLEDARRLAAAEAEQALATEVAQLQAKEGVSSEKCQWVGCTGLALRDRAFCARCMFRGQTHWGALAPYHRLLAEVLRAEK